MGRRALARPARSASLFGIGRKTWRPSEDAFPWKRTLRHASGIEGGKEGDVGGGTTCREVERELWKEVSGSYLSYAMSVIVGRALPDARDGLKPVHRRILYAMHELGLSPGKPFRKCARVVGEVLGKYHPHGDTAVYDALVRLAQGFSLNETLVDGHGNFGSLDGDPAAAMRYTECRITKFASETLLEDLGYESVDFAENFDGSYMEPTVMPSRLPQLLINGSSGIAVGMATSIPPHNMAEVTDALLALIEDPGISLEGLMRHVPAPDFPTGGILLDTDGLRSAYANGSGSVTMRGVVHVEEKARSGGSVKQSLIITELPYQTNKAQLVERIADIVNERVVEGISDIRDESDRRGIRVVVELKKHANVDVILNAFYKHTNLQKRFNLNMVALDGAEPRSMGLKEMLRIFLDFRCQVIERRTSYELDRARKKHHQLEGLLMAIQNVDEVVAIIRNSKDTSGARASLSDRFSFSEEQANGVLGMPLRRLTSLEAGNISNEVAELSRVIERLVKLLSSKEEILKVVQAETRELQKRFGRSRRSKIEKSTSGDVDMRDTLPNNECIVVMTAKGFIKRVRADAFTTQNRNTRGKKISGARNGDKVSRVIHCWDHDDLLVFTEQGGVFSLPAFELPEADRSSRGTPLVHLLPRLDPSDQIATILALSKMPEDEYLVLLSEGGYIKRTALSSFTNIRSNGILAMHQDEGDRLRWVQVCRENDSILLASRQGKVQHFSIDQTQLRPTGRMARGVRAMQLAEGDRLQSMSVIPGNREPSDEAWALLVTLQGYGKRVPISEFRIQRRGGMGVSSTKFRPGDRLVSMHVVDQGCTSVVLGSARGNLNRTDLQGIPVQSRGARGVRLLKLDEGDDLHTVALPSLSEEEEDVLLP